MKLKDWADQTGVKYLTAYRWFKNGTLPVPAYQTQTGTIIVEPEIEEHTAVSQNEKDNAMSLFLKKTVEFSKNSSTVEDFAAYVISNFQLKLNGAEKTEAPKYSRLKPKPEEIRKHFQQFIPDKNLQAQLKTVKTLLSEGQAAGDVVPAEMSNLLLDPEADASNPAFDSFFAPLSSAFSTQAPPPVEGLAITPNVDCSTITTVETPQSINYTGSTTSQLFNNGGNSFGSDISSVSASNMAAVGTTLFNSTSTAFQPINLQQTAAKVMEAVPSTNDKPRKRGRKPTKR
jgi:hypothetical protein